VEKVKIFNEIILKVKNFSLSFRIFLKGKMKISGIFLESENFQNLKMIESKKFKNNLKV